MTEIGQHPLGVRAPVEHACPDCPSPLTQTAPGALLRVPNPHCPHCAGTGLVTDQQLAGWQRRRLDEVVT